MYVYVNGIGFGSFYYFTIGFWNRPDSGIFVCFHFIYSYPIPINIKLMFK